MICLTSKIEGASPIISYFLATFFLRALFSFFNSLFEESNVFRSKALRTVVNNLFKSGGFEIKSYAPFFIASTAKSTSP